MGNPSTNDNESSLVRLISSEGFQFILDKEVAITSKTIRNMLNGPESFIESSTNEIQFQDISGAILEKIVDYLHHKARHVTSPGVELPQFQIEPELALELLMASDFLEI